MARSSAKRGRRARPDARRPSGDPGALSNGPEPAATQASKTGGGVKPVRRGTKVVSRTAIDVPKTPEERAAKREANIEDQLFLTRIRRHMKWVFLFLALAFGIGFVAFGVGSGSGSGISDVIGDLFGANSGARIKSVEEARSDVQNNPDDPDALLALAVAYQNARQPTLQAETLEKYVELRPDDLDSLNQLGRAYVGSARELQNVANLLLQTDSTSVTSEICTFPGTSGLLGAVCDDPIDRAVSRSGSIRANELLVQSNAVFVQAVDTYEKLSQARPDDPGTWISLGTAARDAGDADTQIRAYDEFVKRFPNDPNVGEIKQILEQLKSSNDVLVG